MKRARRIGILVTAVLLLSMVLGALPVSDAAYPEHSATEPTWYYKGVVTSDTGAKMKHVTVAHDPDGLQGVTGSPKFMMWWGTSNPDELFAARSDDGVTWSGTGSARTKLSVSFPSLVVPVYHPEVIYEPLGFEQKKSDGTVHFKMWFYDGGYEAGAGEAGSYSWIRYAESADGMSWQIYEDSTDTASLGKNYVEFRSVSCNEISVLYKRDGTGIEVSGNDQKLVAYHGYLDVATDGAWFEHVSTTIYGPTDISREMIIAAPGDSVNYRAWDMLPQRGNVTSWDSDDGLSWSSVPDSGDPPISGASWSDFYGGMCVVVVGDRYYMYDTIESDQYSVGLLIAPLLSPAEVWVDDDYCVGCPNDGHLWGYDAFATIQDGIDAVAGSTVNVAAGTYNEDVTVDKSLTLSGAQAGVDARGRSASESEIVGVVKVTSGATNVVFDGLKLTSPTRAFTPRGFNLRVESQNSTISNNIFVAEENEGHTYSGYLDFEGITNTTVEQNSFSGHLDPVQGPNVIRLGVSGAGTVTIANNEMHDVGGGGGIGIMCSNAGAIINIDANEIDNTGDGVWIWAPTSLFDTISITNNHIHDCVKKGVKIVAGAVGGVEVNYNSIYNSGEEGVFNGQSSPTVNAMYNWWGDVSGPYHPTSWFYGAVEITNPAGLGDEVTDYVLYDPWIGKAGMATGGGWFFAEANGGHGNVTPGGKATFGFVARQKSDKSSGQLEFQYKTDGLNLNSTSYDWVAVAATQVMFEGIGRLNGADSYKFRVRAVDGDAVGGAAPDRFEIRIWIGDDTWDMPTYRAEGYLEGGQIVVHKKKK